ncbi:MAG: DUF6261 family protein [Prevotellaceae bacterium]|nr:DUF6261 family protein [Prevotellaceae bacterium]
MSIQLAAAGNALKTAVAPLMPEFNAALTLEDAVMQWVRKSVLTARIAEADQTVDRVLVGINAIVQASLHASSATVVAAAERVHIMLKEYGNVAREAYNEEAGDVRAILEHFTGASAADVVTLGLTTWVTDLNTGFNTFKNLLRQRDTEQGTKPAYTATDVRKRIETVWHQMVYIIDAHSVVGESTDFDAFIDLLNPTIDRLNAQFSRTVKDLSEDDHTVIEPIPAQLYTGAPVVVIPVVYYHEDDNPPVALELGKDFSVTYKNNVNAGMAQLTIYGKGGYKGQVGRAFDIVNG